MTDLTTTIQEKISFDSWWVLVKDKIPKRHMKEIIFADFKGRKLSDMETKETYDAALKLYGINIKS